MVFLSPVFHEKTISSDPNFTEVPPLPPSVINQVDLASTISLLTGTPIPTENTGVFILPVLRSFLTANDLQEGVCSLALQLYNVLASHADLNVEHTIRVENIKSRFCQKKFSANYQEVEESVESLRKISEILSTSSSEYGVFDMGLAIVLLLVCIILHSCQLSKCPERAASVWLERATAEKAAVGLFIFHALCLTSSSFIEEEHQLWYMWIPSSYFFLMAKFRKSEKRAVWRLAVLLLLHRILREWNRTGNKWADLPDIGDWLRE
jgi:ethanolamine phosphate transferase 2 subunit G